MHQKKVDIIDDYSYAIEKYGIPNLTVEAERLQSIIYNELKYS